MIVKSYTSKFSLLILIMTLMLSELSACPGCTYNRNEPIWLQVMGLKILFVLILTYKIFDPVRLMLALFVYEGVFFVIWRQLAWFSHPAISGDNSIFFMPIVGIVNFGVPLIYYLKYLSRFDDLKKSPELQVTYKRAILVIPCFILAELLGLLLHEHI